MKKTKLSLILLSLTIIASITISSCKKDDTDDTTTPTTTPTTNENDLSVSKFTATIDGTNYSYIEGTDFEGICGTDKNVGDSATIIYSYEIWNNANNSSAGITKGTLVSHSGSVASTTLFNSFITTSTCSFSDNAANGIEIKWKSSPTNVWTTTGTNQAGSSFSFAIVNYTDVMGSHYARFKATFNCKLTNGSTVKTLTNGVFIGSFENQ